MAISRREFTVGSLSLLGGSLVRASAEEVPPFICMTNQFTPYDTTRNITFYPTANRNAQVQLDTQPSSRSIEYSPYQLLLRSDAWQPSDSLPGSPDNRIRVGIHYMDGNSFQHDAVQQYATEWLVANGANKIEFAFGTSERSHVQILFKTPLNKSALGRQAKLYTDQSQPTMWLGDVHENNSPDRIAEVIRHEFGHVLGMRHEHQHPQGGIEWDRKTVIAFYKSQGWTKTDVEEYVFKVYGDSSYLCPASPAFDPMSIMMYPIPPGFAKNIVVQRNITIRPNDFSCIHSIYA